MRATMLWGIGVLLAGAGLFYVMAGGAAAPSASQPATAPVDAVAADVQPIRTSGLTVVEGKTVPFEAEYWPSGNRTIGYRPVGPGNPQPWLAATRGLSAAHTVDEFLSYYSKASRQAAQKYRSALQKVVARNEKTSWKEFKHQTPFIVYTHGPDAERVFVVRFTQYVDMKQPPPIYSVFVYVIEDGEYKMDKTQVHSGPSRALQYGQWKQFGYPINLSLPPHVSLTDGATRPASQPASTAPIRNVPSR